MGTGARSQQVASNAPRRAQVTEKGTPTVVDVEKVLDEAGLSNPAVREFVQKWADHTGAERIEVVNASDDARLIQEGLDAGEIKPAGDGLYYSQSYFKDTARSEERTVVATNDPKDKGVYNNWRHPTRSVRSSRAT